MFDEVGDHVEGEMSIPGQPKKDTGGPPEFNTLDEPIRDTVVSFQLFLYIVLRIFCFDECVLFHINMFL